MLTTKYRERQFVVSLDSLDLTLLRQYVEKSNGDQRLLWTVPELGESTLYEVKLVSEDVDYESSYIELSTTIMCHICNIHVPQMYFKQHTKSVMHNNYTRLVEKVLENVSKQISIDIENTEDNDQGENFYCETCCKVVLIAHRQKHIKSNYHLKCNERQKQIDLFFKIYTEDQEIASETDTIDSRSETRDMNMTQTNINNLDIQFSTDSDWSEPASDHSSTLSIPNNKTTLDNFNPEYNIKYSDTIENKIKDKNSIQSLHFDLDDSVYIVTSKGYKQKVKQRNFHSCVEYSSLCFCQLCDKWLGKDIHEHIKSEEHSTKIVQPIKDDFTRIVDKKSHCLLCNTIVDTDTDHANVHTNHKQCANVNVKRIDTNVKPDGIGNKINKKTKEIITAPFSQKKIQGDKQHRDICKLNVRIDKTQKYYLGNEVQSTNNACIGQDMSKTARNESLKICNEIDTISTEIITSSLENVTVDSGIDLQKTIMEYNGEITKFSATEIKCLICNSKIPNTDIVKHVKSSIHIYNLNLKLRQNRIVKVTNQLYNCQLCKTNINDFVEHINGNESHIKKKVLSTRISKDKLREYVYKDLSNNSPVARVYRDIYKDLLRENSIFKDHTSLLTCSVCKIKMTRISEIDHMFGQRHSFFLAETANS